MAPDEQRIAIAAELGIETRQKLDNGKWFGRRDKAWVEVPDYLHDLNAMHEAEKTLTHKQRSEYMTHICGAEGMPLDVEQTDDDCLWLVATATSAQRAEAFLRTKGLWVE